MLLVLHCTGLIDIFRVSVNATPEALPDTLKQVEKFVSALPGKPEVKPVYTKVSSLCWPMWQIEKQTEKKNLKDLFGMETVLVEVFIYIGKDCQKVQVLFSPLTSHWFCEQESWCWFFLAANCPVGQKSGKVASNSGFCNCLSASSVTSSGCPHGPLCCRL